MIDQLEKAKHLKEKLRAGEPCLGAQIALNDPAVAEIFGFAGFDWLVVDTEHAANTVFTVRAMLQAAAATPAVMLARPLRLDADEIRRFLDLGAQGILCPFINSGDEAQAFVKACRYPPAGIRGYGPRRAGAYGFEATEYFERANDCLMCIPIIESKEGVENIQAIVEVDGIDGVCIGPMDLSISLGVFQQFRHPVYLDAVKRVHEACRKSGKAMGTGCLSLEDARSCVSAGYGVLLVGGDDAYLSSESRRWLQSLRPERKI
jgi:2-keto-3-deoxy-L-rhamnonate aldolase RhmA